MHYTDMVVEINQSLLELCDGSGTLRVDFHILLRIWCLLSDMPTRCTKIPTEEYSMCWI